LKNIEGKGKNNNKEKRKLERKVFSLFVLTDKIKY
jgi:hypothetical protein